MDYLDMLEGTSIYILREAYHHYKNSAILWAMGKDSTAMLWIARKAFFGKIPFPVIHIETSYELKEIIQFRELYSKEWNIDLVIAKNVQALTAGMGPQKADFDECCQKLKTEALKEITQTKKYQALLLGIRGDELGRRSKKDLFSSRGTDTKGYDIGTGTGIMDIYASGKEKEHDFRIHPLSHWTEYEIWLYTKREKIPVVDLYFAKNGKRFRNIGCEPCITQVDSDANTIDKIMKEIEAATLSSGDDAQKDEDAYTTQKLKSLGYM